MKQKVKGALGLLFATVIWGFAFTAQSVGMEKIGPFTFQAVRCALAAAFLFPAATGLDLRKKSLSDSMHTWADPKLWKAGICCGCALFVAASLQQVGLVYTDAGKAGFLTAMYIVIVPVFGLFFGKKLPKTVIFSVLLAVAGLYLLSCLGVRDINHGDLLLMGCAVAFAVQITCIDRLAGSLDGMRLNCVQALVVCLLSVPFMLATEQVEISNLLACWGPLCFAGILSMGVAYTLQIEGQKALDPTAASILMSLESVFAVLGGWWLLGETMTVPEILGCMLVFAAVILSQLPVKKESA